MINEKYKKALWGIAYHKHCMYGSGDEYERGVADGHRYAAIIAKEALKLTEEERDRLEELEEKANEAFKNYSGFNPKAFLSDEEGKEWEELFNEWLHETT